MNTKEVEELIKSKIPITNELAFKIESWDGQTCKLFAPFEKNRNHHGTAFGGSLAMSAIVSGYCMSFMLLDDALGEGWLDDYTLVIKDFSCQYLKPVSGDIQTSSSANPLDIVSFLESLERKGRGRLKVLTKIVDGQERLVANATFVAFKD